MAPKASLAGLPAEIRQKIFSHVIKPAGIHETDLENRWLTEHLGDLTAIHYFNDKPPRLIKSFGGAPGHQLLRVSRTCYREAAPLLYESQGFYLFNDYDWSMWWRIQPFLYPPSFEIHHMKHPVPSVFAFIRELAFQPRPEISADFARAIENSFPCLAVLRAFRHIYLHEPDGLLTGELPDVWREFHRFVLLAALVLTSNHSTLKYAKWSDWRFFPHENAEDSVRIMTIKLTPDEVVSSNEDGLLDLERISKLPLSDSDAWTEAVTKENLRIEDFFIRTEGTQAPEQDASRRRRIRSSEVTRN